MKLSDGDYDMLRELEHDARLGPSAYTPTDEDYARWTADLELTLPPLAPDPPAADDGGHPDPENPW